MVATEFKEPGEPVEATWTSTTFNVSGAVVGAGGETCTYPGDSGPLPHFGDVETCEGTGGAASLEEPVTSDGAGLTVSGLDRLLELLGIA